MKIVILTQYFVPEMGAPQNRLYELSIALQKLGWQLEIVTAMPNYPTGRIFDDYRGSFYRFESKPFSIHRFWLYPSKSNKAIPRILSMLSFSLTCLFSLLKIRRFRPDYIFVESPPLTLALSGWLLARSSGAKLIMNVSDLWPLSAKELGAISEGMLYRILQKLESFLYKRAHICTGQSQQIIDYISAEKKQRVFLLRNGVDTRRFDVNDKTERKYRVVYAGLLGVAQGIFNVCRSIDFAAFGLEFHIYGSGNEQERIISFVKENPSRGIVYHGIMDREVLANKLKDYDGAIVALVKNIYGAVPSKIYESMAAGLPILFSGAGEGATLIIENNVGWVSAPDDIEGFKENLRKFRELPIGVLNTYSQRARMTAIENYDRQRQVLDFHRFLFADLQRVGPTAV